VQWNNVHKQISVKTKHSVNRFSLQSVGSEGGRGDRKRRQEEETGRGDRKRKVTMEKEEKEEKSKRLRVKKRSIIHLHPLIHPYSSPLLSSPLLSSPHFLSSPPCFLSFPHFISSPRPSPLPVSSSCLLSG